VIERALVSGAKMSVVPSGWKPKTSLVDEPDMDVNNPVVNEVMAY
jgi:hypothetical protein